MPENSTPQPSVVIVTGGVGSGKSTVLETFREQGFDVGSADEEAHRLLQSDTTVQSCLREAFGGQIFNYQGSVDRQALAQIVFNDSTERRKLEDILHPKIRKQFEQRVALQPLERPLIYEVPLYFETGKQYPGRPLVLVVVSPDDLALQRLERNPRFSKEQFVKRKAAQVSDEVRVAGADYVIVNDSSVENLKSHVSRFIDTFLSNASSTGSEDE